jgi:type IV pilus assembly protein PilM
MAGSQAAWGIDVGVSSLKALKLRRDGDRVAVEEFEVIEHDKFLTEPDVDRDTLIRETLKKFMAKYSVRRDVVYIGVPGSSTFARFVKLPPVETRKIPEIVRFEAIQQIPFPLEQVNWDYHTFQHPDSPDVEVGIFAMKKELVAHVMSNFRAVGMMVHGVQMSPLAVYNTASYDSMTEDKGTVVIDMGAEHTDLVIMDQGRMWLRSINIGGNHFTDALAKSFKQQFAKAETLKKTAATSKYQKQIYQAMRPVFADLVSEIQRSLGAYNSTHRDSRLEHIVCMGNPFKLPNLQKYLQQELKMEVSRLENFRKATVEKAAAFSENILSMSAAYGLAVQALGFATIDTNLLPIEIARSMMWKRKEPWFIAASAVVVVGAASFAYQWWSARSEMGSASHESLVAENNHKQGEFDRLKNDWNNISDTYAVEQTQVEKQFKLMAARKVWPMIYGDVMGSLPQAGRGNRNVIVLTDVISEYSPTLSSVKLIEDTAVPGAGGMAGVGLGGVVTPTTPAAGGTAATQAVGQVGPSDHGFRITISGYAPSPGDSLGGPRKVVDDFQAALVARGNERTLDKSDRPFYYESEARYTGNQVQAITGGAAFGGGFGGGGAGAQATYKPWGGFTGAKGPYWDSFFQDLTGYKPPSVTPSPGMMTAAQPETAYENPIDLFEVRKTLPPTSSATPKGLAGAFYFSLRVKVHIQEDK